MMIHSDEVPEHFAADQSCLSLLAICTIHKGKAQIAMEVIYWRHNFNPSDLKRFHSSLMHFKRKVPSSLKAFPGKRLQIRHLIDF